MIWHDKQVYWRVITVTEHYYLFILLVVYINVLMFSVYRKLDDERVHCCDDRYQHIYIVNVNEIKWVNSHITLKNRRLLYAKSNVEQWC